MGAAVLVLVGVLGFPLLFDTQPRPISVDVPIEIPSRNASSAPKSELPAAPSASRPSSVSTSDSLASREEVVEPKAAEPAKERASDIGAQKPGGKPQEKSPEKPADPVATKPAADKPVADKPADPATGKATTGNERIVVQVGAFSEVERAREARLKLERAGLKTYTHVAETPQGRRIRVRLGPFATKAEADKAAARAKALGLPVALLWL